MVDSAKTQGGKSMSGSYTYNYPNVTLTRDLNGAQELCEKLEDYGL